MKSLENNYLLLSRVTSGARNPNLQVTVTHARDVCCQHSFVPTLRNGMHKTQSDRTRFRLLSEYACFDLLSGGTCAKHSAEARAFYLGSIPKPLVITIQINLIFT